jgi:predicted dehydrogenase
VWQLQPGIEAAGEPKMTGDVKLALVGIGGYGGIYADAILGPAAPAGHRLACAVDPYPEASPYLPELQQRGVPVYPTLEAMYASCRPDLIVISSPIHLHSRHTIEALGHGSHVLCEKPLCVTTEQAREMIRARDAARREVAIGYQWSFSPAIQRLKRDILAGVFGQPKRLTTMVLWPRDETYYRRNKWAGRLYTGQGHPVFDSPVNNACAHYLHNMFYVLGDRTDTSAAPARVTAELYRANAIETYDTAALRCWTSRGVEIVFLVSHATGESRGPLFRYEFTGGTVEYRDDADGGEIIGRLTDGSTTNYGVPPDGHDMGKLWATVEAVRSGTPTVCGIEAALPQTQVVCAAQDSTPAAAQFPRDIVRVEGEPGAQRVSVHGLEDVLGECYARDLLPSELGASWAVPAREVTIPTFRGAVRGPAMPPGVASSSASTPTTAVL